MGPDPYEHLLAALGTCTSMTVRMYANRKQWPLDDIDIRLTPAMVLSTGGVQVRGATIDVRLVDPNIERAAAAFARQRDRQAA